MFLDVLLISSRTRLSVYVPVNLVAQCMCKVFFHEEKKKKRDSVSLNAGGRDYEERKMCHESWR